MTNKFNLSMLRKLTFAPAAIAAIVSAASFGFSAETRVHIRGGKMETRISNGKVTLTGLQGEVGSGRIQMEGNIGVGAADEVKTVAVNFADVPVTDVARMVNADVPQWLGNVLVSGTVKGEWQGEGFKEIGNAAKGALHIKTGSGTITDQAILTKLANLLKVDELTALKYAGITIKAHAQNGILVVDEISAEGPEFSVRAKGNYVTKADVLDLRIDLAVSQEIAGRSTYLKLKNVFGIFGGSNEEIQTAEGLIEVPRLVVSGELKKPQVKIDNIKSAAPGITAKSSSEKPVQQIAFSHRLKNMF